MPILCPTMAYHGLNNDSHIITAHVCKNKEKYAIVVAALKP
jgi:hypothetical protein